MGPMRDNSGNNFSRPFDERCLGLTYMHYSAMEMTMWTMVNAQERTREEWEEVVRLTDERLAILSINRPANSWDSLIEIGWKSLL